MSTDYILLVKPDNVEMYVLEHSNVFDVCIEEGELTTAVLSDLTLDQLKQVRDKLSQVISYFE